MTKFKAALGLSAIMMLGACGGAEQEAAPQDDAADFAARINGNVAQAPSAKPASTSPAAGQQTGNVVQPAVPTGAPVPPTVARPRPDAAQGAFSAGTATDPLSVTCAANAMGPFIGKRADDLTRLAIEETAEDASEVRFIEPGGTYIRPDATNPRLNIMLDQANIIRDARCG